MPASRANDRLFEQVLGTAQSLAGVRIAVMVAGLIPDGRGLGNKELTGRDKRIRVLSEDARQAETNRREMVRTQATESERSRADRRSYRATLDGTGASGPRGSRRAADPGDAAPSPPGQLRPPVGPQRSPFAQPSSPADANETVDRAAGFGPRGLRIASSAGQGPAAGGEPARGPGASGPSPPASASPQVHAIPRHAPVESASMARQVGEALGARTSGTTGRAGSVNSTAPAAEAGSADRVRTEPRAAARADSERTSSRSPAAERSRAGPRAAFDRLVRGIRMNVGTRHSTARLHLDPPELGRVRIDVRMVDQRLELAIRTETHKAREMLASRLAGLREALSAHGVTIERVELPPPEADGQPRASIGHEQGAGEHPHQFDAQRSGGSGETPPGDDLRDHDSTPPESDPADRGSASETRLDIRA